MADPYTTLGVARAADDAAIKSAYRKLAKELHPDRNKDNPRASERFSQVTQAYDLLSDKSKRAKFDRGEIDADGNPLHPFGGGGAGFGGGFGGGGFGGHPGARPNGPGQNGGRGARGYEGFDTGDEMDLGDIFEGLFGRGGPGGGRSSGGPGGGFGREAPPPPKGANIAYKLSVPFTKAATLAKQRITLADGKTIDLSLPAGLEDGTQMRLKGKGQQGPGGPGDGIVTITVQSHPLFTRDGDDVRLDLPITLDEAVRGGKVKVPTVDGPVMLKIVPGSSSGKVLRLKGKGFTRKSGARGDQLVTLEIHLPEDLTALEQQLEGWSDSEDPRKGLGF